MHNTIDDPSQSVWLYNNCHALICTDCHEPTSDSEKEFGLGDYE